MLKKAIFCCKVIDEKKSIAKPHTSIRDFRAGSSAVEHPTFNRVVVGSIPTRPTIHQNPLEPTIFICATASPTRMVRSPLGPPFTINENLPQANFALQLFQKVCNFLGIIAALYCKIPNSFLSKRQILLFGFSKKSATFWASSRRFTVRFQTPFCARGKFCSSTFQKICIFLGLVSAIF